jgi:putative endonuclease
MACIYVLINYKKDKRYVGSSHKESPEVRLESHNKGKVRSTKYGIPWKIVYSESYENYSDARKRELFLKSGQGRKFLDDKLKDK